ncbi:MAG: alcohol dehydrogenase [Candidatus Thorarchaeota archaeon]|nr:alcohol dehydrogenase [Candidatus Thorarchaeota archaeon]
MKAVVIDNHGPPEVLSYREIEQPEPSKGQVLIEIKAVALNHLDLFVRSGIPGLKLKMPHILGSDISGVVVESNQGASDALEPGTPVIIDPGVSCGICEFCIRGEDSLCQSYGILGEHYPGGYAEYLAIDSSKAIPIPERSGLDFVEAAAVPLTFMTAWRLLVTKAQIRPGDDVLIIGIGGGVALAALQIAKAAGARIFVTSSSGGKIKKAKALGAYAGINYLDTPDYHKEIHNLTEKRGVDIVLDSVGAATWEKSIRSLRKGGRLVTCGATSGPIATTNVNLLFWRQLEVLGSTMASRAELNDVLRLVWDKELHPIVDRAMPLSEAPSAHTLLEEGRQFGKIVLTP